LQFQDDFQFDRRTPITSAVNATMTNRYFFDIGPPVGPITKSEPVSIAKAEPLEVGERDPVMQGRTCTLHGTQ